MRIFDSHCHLDHVDFEGTQQQIVERALVSGVSHLITIGSSDGLDSCVRARALAARFSNVFATAGVHPHSAALDHQRAPELDRVVAETDVVAIGETGLDYHYDFAPKADQMWWFERQLDLAQQNKKPVVIHCREAAHDVLSTLKRFPAVTGVFHCFTENEDVARRAVDLGFFISASGIVTFKSSESIRAAFKIVPLDRILVETDAPFLAPIPNRGKRNESAFIVHTLSAIAAVKQIPVETLAEQTFFNTVKLFQLENKI
jgi:TatD DNase family protein